MPLRSQRRAGLFPSVRLNFSRDGVSATVGYRGGVEPAYRAPIGEQQYAFGAAPSRLNELPTLAEPRAGLGEFEALAREAASQHRELTRTAAAEAVALRKITARLAFSRTFIVRIATGERVPGLMEAAAAAQAKLEAAQAEVAACHVDVDFALDDAATASYAAVVGAFEQLSACQAIWDVTASRAGEAAETGGSAARSIARVPVSFGQAGTGFIASRLPVLRLGAAGGREIKIYPSLVIVEGAAAGEVTLLEFGSMITSCSSTTVVETGKVPSDAELTGETWQDGSAKTSRALPVVRYGELEMVTLDGFHQVYMVSDFNRVSAFVRAYLRHVAALADLAKRAPAAEGWPIVTSSTAAKPAPETKPWKPILVGDWISLMALVMLATFGVLTVTDRRPTLKPPSMMSVTTPVEKAKPERGPAKAAARRSVRRAANAPATSTSQAAPPVETRPVDDPESEIPF